MYIENVFISPSAANCYILCDETTGEGAVVDPGDYTAHLLKAIEKSPVKNLKYILCTHGHFDHTGGVCRLKEHYPEALVAIGAGDAAALSDSILGLFDIFGVPFYPSSADLRLRGGDTVALGGISFKVLETPGHTAGGVCYYCEDEKILISGDTLFCGSVGRTDFPGGSMEILKNSLEKLKALPDETAVYPGHNGETDIGSEKRYNPYL